MALCRDNLKKVEKTIFSPPLISNQVFKNVFKDNAEKVCVLAKPNLTKEVDYDCINTNGVNDRARRG